MKPRAPKLACPVCHHWDSLVDDGRGHEPYESFHRVRVCQGCGARYLTHEVVVRVLKYPAKRTA